MAEHSLTELKSMQAAPLDVKVMMTQSRIREWVREFGTDGVYVSFSGGKDSTVLLTIVREMYPEIPAVFCDTGLEYPEIRQFVKTWDNVTWLKPKMNFRKVIEKYGYPMISKEISEKTRKAIRGFNVLLDEGIVSKREIKNLQFDKTVEYIADNYEAINNKVALCKLLGIFDMNNRPDKTLYNSGKGSMYNCNKWLFMINAPFRVSENCCYVRKKVHFINTKKRQAERVFWLLWLVKVV